MGAISRPKYQDRHGVIQESAVCWVRFRQHGKTLRQAAETRSEAKARAFLREREGKVALKIPVNIEATLLTLDDAADAADLIRNDYTANGRKSANIESRAAAAGRRDHAAITPASESDTETPVWLS